MTRKRTMAAQTKREIDTQRQYLDCVKAVKDELLNLLNFTISPEEARVIASEILPENWRDTDTNDPIGFPVLVATLYAQYHKPKHKKLLPVK
jgi:hypothetical protein